MTEYTRNCIEKFIGEKHQNDKLKVLSLLNTYEKGQFIYPSVVVRHTGWTTAESIEFLNKLSKKGLLSARYQFMCPFCGQYGRIYTSVSDIPEEWECEKCMSDLFVVRSDYIRQFYAVEWETERKGYKMEKSQDKKKQWMLIDNVGNIRKLSLLYGAFVLGVVVLSRMRQTYGLGQWKKIV